MKEQIRWPSQVPPYQYHSILLQLPSLCTFNNQTTNLCQNSQLSHRRTYKNRSSLLLVKQTTTMVCRALPQPLLCWQYMHVVHHQIPEAGWKAFPLHAKRKIFQLTIIYMTALTLTQPGSNASAILKIPLTHPQ